MTKDSPDTPTVWKDTQHERFGGRLEIERESQKDGPMDEGERPSVDWMDFSEDDGGPTRNAVHLGKRELESEEGESDAGIDVGETDEVPDVTSEQAEELDQA